MPRLTKSTESREVFIGHLFLLMDNLTKHPICLRKMRVLSEVSLKPSQHYTLKHPPSGLPASKSRIQIFRFNLISIHPVLTVLFGKITYHQRFFNRPGRKGNRNVLKNVKHIRKKLCHKGIKRARTQEGVASLENRKWKIK